MRFGDFGHARAFHIHHVGGEAQRQFAFFRYSGDLPRADHRSFAIRRLEPPSRDLVNDLGRHHRPPQRPLWLQPAGKASRDQHIRLGVFDHRIGGAFPRLIPVPAAQHHGIFAL